MTVDDNGPGGDARFLTTHWTMVVRAGAGGEQARASLEQLFAAYWFPLYAYLRRAGRDEHAAEDLVQGFLTSLLERADLAAVDRERGRFRHWLLASLRHFDISEWEKSQTLKRGAGRTLFSLDAQDAASRFEGEISSGRTPEREFARAWALALLDRAFARLESEYDKRGNAELFHGLRNELVPGGTARPRAELASDLGLREGALKVALHRLRQRFGEALRSEVAETVNDEEELELELAELLEALGAE